MDSWWAIVVFGVLDLKWARECKKCSSPNGISNWVAAEECVRGFPFVMRSRLQEKFLRRPQGVVPPGCGSGRGAGHGLASSVSADWLSGCFNDFSSGFLSAVFSVRIRMQPNGFSRAIVPGGMSRSEEVSGRGAAQVAPLLVHSSPLLSARGSAGSPGCVCHCWGGVAGSSSASTIFPQKKDLRRRSVRGECASSLGVNSNTGRGGARLQSGSLRRPMWRTLRYASGF